MQLGTKTYARWLLQFKRLQIISGLSLCNYTLIVLDNLYRIIILFLKE